MSSVKRQTTVSSQQDGVSSQPVETHPFEPFLPEGCRLLMLGSFPPSEKRWSMRFYYPNFTNDMWRIFGLCFFNDKLRFVDTTAKSFCLEPIKAFLTTCGIGLYDTHRCQTPQEHGFRQRSGGCSAHRPASHGAQASTAHRHRDHRTKSHRCALPVFRHRRTAQGRRVRDLLFRTALFALVAHAQQLKSLSHEGGAQSRVL